MLSFTLAPGFYHTTWRFKKENGVIVSENFYDRPIFGYADDVSLNKRNRRIFRMSQTKARKRDGIA